MTGTQERASRPSAVPPRTGRGSRLLASAVVIACCAIPAGVPGQGPVQDRHVSDAAGLVRQGDLDGAIRLLQEAAEARPQDVDVLLMLGSALSHIPRRSEAVQALLRAIELSPGEARVHASAGTVFAKLGEHDAALQVLERAVSLDPGLGDAHLNIALILAARQEFDRASGHLSKALAIESDTARLARLRFLKGKLQTEEGRLEEAVEEFRLSVALDPGSGEAHLALGLTLKRLLREDEAYPVLRKAADLSPNDPTAHYQLALELQRRGRHDDAANHFLEAHELRPGDRSVVYNLVRALHKAGRTKEARRYRTMLAELIESGDVARESKLETARLHREAVRLDEAGSYAEALDRYRAVLEIEPLNTTARRNLALVLCRLGRWNEGIEELEAMLRSDPDDVETARTLVIVEDEVRRSKIGTDAEAGPGSQAR